MVEHPFIEDLPTTAMRQIWSVTHADYGGDG
jgi:hypothetical protein